ncbi:MAG TPA: hypothetical protein VJ865_10690, partial [Gemmatimonadaceae bacterium]|nr:hypothetical protein [Gemmatimonadaceae bacterium]
MAKETRKQEEEEGGEFAEFLADVSQEIAARVESLQPAPQQAAPIEKKRTPVVTDGGVIVEWPNIADRM